MKVTKKAINDLIKQRQGGMPCMKRTKNEIVSEIIEALQCESWGAATILFWVLGFNDGDSYEIVEKLRKELKP